jgi:hypothetical protein
MLSRLRGDGPFLIGTTEGPRRGYVSLVADDAAYVVDVGPRPPGVAAEPARWVPLTSIQWVSQYPREPGS